MKVAIGPSWPMEFQQISTNEIHKPGNGRLCATLLCRTINIVEIVPLTVSLSTAKSRLVRRM
jgi:hypothetical protein